MSQNLTILDLAEQISNWSAAKYTNQKMDFDGEAAKLGSKLEF